MMCAQPTDGSHVDQGGRELDEAQLRAAFARISRLTSSGEPKHLRGYLVAPSDKPLIAGSSVPALGQFVQTPGGILIPATARVAKAPLDLALSYIIISELVDQAPCQWPSRCPRWWPAKVPTSRDGLALRGAAS